MREQWGLGGIGDEAGSGGGGEGAVGTVYPACVFPLPLSLICMAGGGELLSSGEPP